MAISAPNIDVPLYFNAVTDPSWLARGPPDRLAKGEKPPKNQFTTASIAAIKDARAVDPEVDETIVPADPWEVMVLSRSRGASPPRRHLGYEPDGRPLEVVASQRLATTQPARLDLDGVDVLLVVAVVGDELRAAVGAGHFERALRPGLLVTAEPEVELLAPFFRSIFPGVCT